MNGKDLSSNGASRTPRSGEMIELRDPVTGECLRSAVVFEISSREGFETLISVLWFTGEREKIPLSDYRSDNFVIVSVDP